MPANYLVNRKILAETKVEQTEAVSISTGEAVLQVDRFALTANNITYGVAGDMIGYWDFFPAGEGWGRIPVWGIGTVTASGHPDLAVGDRCYGYYPMSSELVVRPEKVNARGFIDASAHRAALPIVYNQYSLMTAANGFNPDHDNHYMLYRPLFTTSFVLDDYFADNNFFGAKTMVLGSASSKTAFGLAFMLKRRGYNSVIGLTSSANIAFCKNLGLYDVVLSYDDVEQLPLATSAYVDMSGNGEVLNRVHHHLTDNLVNSCGVGITHHQSGLRPAADSMPGPKPEGFFAPTQIIKRNQELGSGVYQQRIGDATQAFLDKVDMWVTIQERPFEELDDVYHTVLNGASPDRGYVITVAPS